MKDNIKRVFLVVLDSFGIGEAPDAEFFGDEGSDTLGAVVKSEKFNAPNLTQLGLFAIDGQKDNPPRKQRTVSRVQSRACASFQTERIPQ